MMDLYHKINNYVISIHTYLFPDMDRITNTPIHSLTLKDLFNYLFQVGIMFYIIYIIYSFYQCYTTSDSDTSLDF